MKMKHGTSPTADAAPPAFRPHVYPKSELASLYFPRSTPHTALQNLSRWIARCQPLREGLEALGYDKHRKYYLTPEVELIVRHLGEP